MFKWIKLRFNLQKETLKKNGQFIEWSQRIHLKRDRENFFFFFFLEKNVFRIVSRSKIWMESSKKMENAEEQSPLLERKISTPTKIAYALGHIFNDLTAAMWFSYTLIYFQRVALLEPIVAGALLLLGKKKKKKNEKIFSS